MTNSIPISWLYILILCIRVSWSFHITFYHIHKVINIFWWFCQFGSVRYIVEWWERVSLKDTYLFGFLCLKEFFHPLLVPSSSFSWGSGWILWFYRLFCAFSNNLLSTFTIPCYMPLYSLSMQWLYSVV